MAFCQHCGFSLTAGAGYCVSCGARAPGTQAAGANGPPPAAPGPALGAHVPGAQASIGQSDDALGIFVGPRHDFYQRKWSQLSGVSAGPSWNWPAFFLGVGWLGYRKMYLYSVIYLGISFMLNFLWYIFDISDAATIGIILGVSVAFGAIGNQLYRAHAVEKCRQIQLTTHPDRLRLELATAGGTNVAMGIGLLVAQVVIEIIQSIVLEAVLY